MTFFIQKHIWWQVHKKYVIVTYMLTYDIDVFPKFSTCMFHSDYECAVILYIAFYLKRSIQYFDSCCGKNVAWHLQM